MPYQIHLFDSSDNRVAILQDEILTSADLDLSMSAAPTLTISMPLSEAKSSFISPLYYAKIYNDNAAAYEHSVFELVDPDIEDSESGLQIKATYQGILTRLSDEHIDAYDTGSAGDTFTNVITDILAFQINTPAITVGTLEPTNTVAMAVESTNIYSALNSIRDAYGGWFEVDSLYRLNWYNGNTGDPMREIRRSKNLKSLKYTPQYSRVVNRVYAYGKGESTARINLTDAGEAHEYIDDAASRAIYGVRAKKYINKSITHPATLLAYAQRILEEYKNPPYQYTVDVVNLAEVSDYDYSLESLALDTRIRVIDDLLSVDVDTSIVSMSINLLAPEEISIELSTVKNDLSDLFGQVLSVQDIQSSVATQIGAGQVTVLGTFTVIDWASAGTTEIDGSNITTGSITLSTVNGGSGSIQSADYSAGSDGWKINSAGDAEFNNVTIRGNLDACSIGSGKTLTLNGLINCGNVVIDGSSGTIIIDGAGDIKFISVGSIIKFRNDDNTSTISSMYRHGVTLGNYSSEDTIDLDGIHGDIKMWGGDITGVESTSVGVQTFEIDASTGNAEFNGTLSVNIIESFGAAKITFLDGINLGSNDLICGDIDCNDIRLDSTGDIDFGGIQLRRIGSDLYWGGTQLN